MPGSTTAATARHDDLSVALVTRWRAVASPLLGLLLVAAVLAGSELTNASVLHTADLAQPGATAPTMGQPATGPRVEPRAHTHAKRGVGAWQVPHVAASLRKSGVGWFYNWDTSFDYHVPSSVGYVPMIWGADSVTPDRLALAKAHGPDLLTFNEPDYASQANMTVGQALDLWPQLEATGLRLGSPAVAYGADTPDGWLDRFMQGARQRGDRVDFIALHWYGADFDSPRAVQQLHDYLQAVHQRYHKPIWLTEFALMRFDDAGHATLPSPSTQAAFASSAMKMLDRLPWLERYAWFAMPAPANGASTGLFRPDGRATQVGRAFEHARG